MSFPPRLATAPATPITVTEHDALPVGTHFGEFEIVRVVGVGGFGIVYLARDHSLEREVALKEYMPASLAARGQGAQITVRSASFAETYAVGLRSFINEARLLARFDHPSLVKVYRFWEDNATAYMVMPYLQGRTLRETRRAMAHPPDEAWIRSVVDPLVSALEQLHREGVYHRDIAPDNIVLPPHAAPVLLDFGAARRVITDRTQSLTAILKPSYAPIEQYAEMTQLRQGPWTDFYALGAVIHYLLFGVPPAPATARAVQEDAEPIEGREVAGVSARFLEIVSWLLAVRPHERPQSAADLRAVLDGRAPVPPRPQHRGPFATSGVPGAMRTQPSAANSSFDTTPAVASAQPSPAPTQVLPDRTYVPTMVVARVDAPGVGTAPTSTEPAVRAPAAPDGVAAGARTAGNRGAAPPASAAAPTPSTVHEVGKPSLPAARGATFAAEGTTVAPPAPAVPRPAASPTTHRPDASPSSGGRPEAAASPTPDAPDASSSPQRVRAAAPSTAVASQSTDRPDASSSSGGRLAASASPTPKAPDASSSPQRALAAAPSTAAASQSPNAPSSPLLRAALAAGVVLALGALGAIGVIGWKARQAGLAASAATVDAASTGRTVASTAPIANRPAPAPGVAAASTTVGPVAGAAPAPPSMRTAGAAAPASLPSPSVLPPTTAQAAAPTTPAAAPSPNAISPAMATATAATATTPAAAPSTRAMSPATATTATMSAAVSSTKAVSPATATTATTPAVAPSPNPVGPAATTAAATPAVAASTKAVGPAAPTTTAAASATRSGRPVPATTATARDLDGERAAASARQRASVERANAERANAERGNAERASADSSDPVPAPAPSGADLLIPYDGAPVIGGARPSRSAPRDGPGRGLSSAGAQSAREACGDRSFIAMAICLDARCEEPRFRQGAECVSVLARKAAREYR